VKSQEEIPKRKLEHEELETTSTNGGSEKRTRILGDGAVKRVHRG